MRDGAQTPGRLHGSLASIPLFAGLPPELVEDLSRRCQWRRYAVGRTIIERDDDSRDVLFVVAGKVRATFYSAAGREVSFRDMVAGDMFGEIAAIDGRPRSLSVRAAAETVLAAMPPTLFWEALNRHPRLAGAILVRLAGVVRSLSERVIEFSTLAVRSRIHAELIRLARESAPGAERAVIMPAPTHADLANRISTHREAVTRELSELARAGVVTKERGSLIIESVARLESLLQEMPPA